MTRNFTPIILNGEITDYEISDDGICRKISTKRIQSSYTDKNTGRKFLKITHNGKRYTKSLARWLALTFLEPPLGDIESFDVDHIDGNPKNDNLNNLQWLTKNENLYKEFNEEQKIFNGEKNGNSKINSDLVIAFLDDYTAGLTITEISRKYNVNENLPRSIISGRNWKHIGEKYECVKNYKKGKTPVKFDESLKNEILDTIRKYPNKKHKDILEYLRLPNDEVHKSLIRRLKKKVKLESSTTIERDPNMLYIDITLD